MADRPILFSAPMVRALLAGTKTQTRRILKPQPHLMSDNGLSYIADDGKGHKPRIEVSDRLWVRETWQGLSFGDYLPTKSSQCDVRYAATDPCANLDSEARGYPWRPSIFMPRWASRLTLSVTEVRVERLQDISEEDAVAEGVEVESADPNWFGYRDYGNAAAMNPFAKGSYRTLWDSINKKPGAQWTDNPWVVAYTFTVHLQNIDKVAA